MLVLIAVADVSNSHTFKIKYPQHRIGKALGYSSFVSIDPDSGQRRQCSHIAKRATQRMQFTGFSNVRLVHLLLSYVLGGIFTSLELGQKLIGRHKERIVLEHPPHDHLGMSAQYVHDGRGAKLIEIIGADYDVIVKRKHVV
jgi:hypothetical protein